MRDVGERALAACWRPDGTVDSYCAQWGGGDDTLRRVLQSPDDAFDALCSADWQFDGRVRWTTLPESLDYLSFDAVFVVSPSGVSVWLPLWFGLPLVDGPVASPLGALVRVETVRKVKRLRRQFRTVKGLLQDAVACGLLSIPRVIAILLCWFGEDVQVSQAVRDLSGYL